MKNYIWLKGLACISIIAIYAMICAIGTYSKASIASDYAQYADTKNPFTSDRVPFPTCRSSFIDVSNDEEYPIPHWIYSLPDDADKALVLAIAKTESRFKPYARSHRGAIGLMQLMPDTAKYMMRKSGGAHVHLASHSNETAYQPRNPFDFKDPYVSLAVGSRYIDYLQSKSYIGQNVAYTLAAYNAGPANLIKWKKRFGSNLSEAAFAKRIPFKETRNYVRKVMKDYHTYQKLLPPIKETVWVRADNC